MSEPNEEPCALAGELGISCDGSVELVDGRFLLCTAHIDALICKRLEYEDDR